MSIDDCNNDDNDEVLQLVLKEEEQQEELDAKRSIPIRSCDLRS